MNLAVLLASRNLSKQFKLTNHGISPSIKQDHSKVFIKVLPVLAALLVSKNLQTQFELTNHIITQDLTQIMKVLDIDDY